MGKFKVTKEHIEESKVIYSNDENNYIPTDYATTLREKGFTLLYYHKFLKKICEVEKICRFRDNQVRVKIVGESKYHHISKFKKLTTDEIIQLVRNYKIKKLLNE